MKHLGRETIERDRILADAAVSGNPSGDQ